MNAEQLLPKLRETFPGARPQTNSIAHAPSSLTAMPDCCNARYIIAVAYIPTVSQHVWDLRVNGCVQ